MTGLEAAAKQLGGEVVAGGEILCPGPNHSDADRSLSVKLDDAAPDGFVVHSFAGDDPVACRDHVRAKLGLSPFKPRKKKNGGAAWTLISEHVYRVAAGAPYLRVRRYLDDAGNKQYPQQRWDGAEWVNGKPKGAKIPYRLPELIAAPAAAIVYIAEGEKCCDALAKLGFVATTNSEGAGKWTADLDKHFKGRHVVIVADNDAPGRKHVKHVAMSLHGVAESVRTLDLAQHWPGEPMAEGDDVADWIAQHDRAGSKLAALVKDAPLWEPSAEPAGGADDADQSEDDAEIKRLAKLSAVQYERERKDAAERLGVRASILDKLVDAERITFSPKDSESFLYGHWDVEPWPQPVDGEILLRAVVETLRRYVVMDGPQATACALWTIMTWVHELVAVHSPILLVNSPVWGSGKTTLLHIFGFLVRRGISTVSITGPALFRSIEKWAPSFALDDVHKAFLTNDDLREVVNSGWTRGDCIIRCDPETHDPRPYKTFCPKAIGMVGRNLPSDTLSRCLTIAMRRKRGDEPYRQ